MAKQTEGNVVTVTLPHVDGEILVRRLVNLCRLAAADEPELSRLVRDVEIGEPYDRLTEFVASTIAAADPEQTATVAEESMASQAERHLRRKAFGVRIDIVFGDGFAVRGPGEFWSIGQMLEREARLTYAAWFARLDNMTHLMAGIFERWAQGYGIPLDLPA